MNSEQQWLPEDFEPGMMAIRAIGHSERRVMIIPNLDGFQLIDAMPKGEKRSARYFIDTVLTPICR
jgi:hypothetical protein